MTLVSSTKLLYVQRG